MALRIPLLVTENGAEAEGRFNIVGEHTGSNHDRNLMVSFDGKTTRSEGPNHNCLLMVPFGGETTS
ncbi:hypothetical protein M5K25_016823 [Dendrobium thyrsiflorum]|uniref:Uncharacterized protein n=1 Tax=Dendrobium thyrsiflorum TaxID=117978 RepID=A0ABD0UKN4_DENTH